MSAWRGSSSRARGSGRGSRRARAASAPMRRSARICPPSRASAPAGGRASGPSSSETHPVTSPVRGRTGCACWRWRRGRIRSRRWPTRTRWWTRRRHWSRCSRTSWLEDHPRGVPPGRDPRRPPDGEGGVLRIATDEGVEGVALAPRRGAGVILGDLVARVLRAELVGADPLQREWLWHRMWEIDRTEELPAYILGLVDTALWDLAGRLGGQPGWQLLGGFRRSIPAQASTATFASTDEYLEVATQCLELGYEAIKLHAWGDARADAQLCLALR